MTNRSTSKRPLTRALIIALLLAVVLVAVAPAAFASSAVGCTGAGCKGKNPEAQGCSAGAYTVASKSNSHEVVQLRYSPACHAFWSRVQSKLASGNIWYTSAWLKGRPSTKVTLHNTRLVWSKMWTNQPSACGVSVSKSHHSNVPVLCTAADDPN